MRVEGLQNWTAPELEYVHARLGATVPYARASEIIARLLPGQASDSTSSVRRHTLSVAQHLEAEVHATEPREPTPEHAVAESPGPVTMGLDGGFVRHCRPRSTRSYEVVVGRIVGHAARSRSLGFVRTFESTRRSRERIRRRVAEEGARPERMTLFTDGDIDLRNLQLAVLPEATHVLDWYHLSRKLTHIRQLLFGEAGIRQKIPTRYHERLHRALAAARRQFPEGDVQHWWLPGGGAGVRTTIAHDVVWLAYATAHFVEVTGDDTILDEPVAFIEGPALEPGQHDAFFEPATSTLVAPLHEHVGRALDLAVERTGENGLPLFLGGDWNDGVNRVGEAGRGESVWLGWFLLGALGSAAAHAVSLEQALGSAGWDGEWYRRGYFDDGTPFGSAGGEECRIDSIGQSWSVLSGAGDPVRSGEALDAVMRELVDPEAGLVRLFTPPFADTDKEPGYIKGYPPGVRENGGQYTHAATWVVQALAELGRLDEALACFRLLNPIGHSLTPEAAERYRVEPYVVAADVYGCGDRIGRGGWTWYTGSAGWLFRVALEGVLGIRRRGDRLLIRPTLPSDRPGWKASLRIDGRTYLIETRRDEGGECVVEVDGRTVEHPEGGVSLGLPDPATPAPGGSVR